jgi:hypothetical protein
MLVIKLSISFDAETAAGFGVTVVVVFVPPPIPRKPPLFDVDVVVVLGSDATAARSPKMLSSVL